MVGMTQTTSDALAPVLTAADLKGFDRNRIHLIREMEEYGWRGRRSNKNHVIMRAPDGETTSCVSRKSISRNHDHDNAREFRTWIRHLENWAVDVTANQEDQPPAPAETAIENRRNGNRQPPKRSIRAAETVTAAPVDTAPEPEPEPLTADVTPLTADVAVRNAQYACEACGGREFAGAQPLSVHHVRVHVKVECQVCDRSMSPSNLPRHLRKHVAVLGTHEEVMREVLRLRADNARVRTEADEWKALAEATEAEMTDLQDGMRALLGG